MSREVRSPVTVERAVLVCECGQEMVWNGAIKPSNPPWYVNECPCGVTDDRSRIAYPAVIVTDSGGTVTVLRGHEE